MSTLSAVPSEGHDLYEQIGARVHQLMWAQRITQTAMAPQMGLAQSVLGRKLRGTVTWTAKDLVLAASILGVPVTALLPDDENAPAPATGQSTDLWGTPAGVISMLDRIPSSSAAEHDGQLGTVTQMRAAVAP